MPREGKGEGDYKSGREYQERTKQFVESGKVEKAAQEAKEALDDEEENAEMERARREGKQKADYDDI